MSIRYTKGEKLLAAEAMIASRDTKNPTGCPRIAAEKAGVPVNTVKAWKAKDKEFQAMMAEEEAKAYGLAVSKLRGSDSSLLEKMVEFQNLAADRLLFLINQLPPDKLSAALADSVKIGQILQGKPTDIVEVLSRLPLEEINTLLAESEEKLKQAHDLNRPVN